MPNQETRLSKWRQGFSGSPWRSRVEHTKRFAFKRSLHRHFSLLSSFLPTLAVLRRSHYMLSRGGVDLSRTE